MYSHATSLCYAVFVVSVQAKPFNISAAAFITFFFQATKTSKLSTMIIFSMSFKLYGSGMCSVRDYFVSIVLGECLGGGIPFVSSRR